MPSIEETVARIVAAQSMNDRFALIRLIPQHHGLGEHAEIYAAVAREVYVQHLAPDFAYIHGAPFYDLAYFQEIYAIAAAATDNFAKVGRRSPGPAPPERPANTPRPPNRPRTDA